MFSPNPPQCRVTHLEEEDDRKVKGEGGVSTADQLFSQLLPMTEEDLSLALLVRLLDHDVTELLTLLLKDESHAILNSLKQFPTHLLI